MTGRVLRPNSLRASSSSTPQAARWRSYTRDAAFALYAQTRVQAALRARQRNGFVRRP